MVLCKALNKRKKRARKTEKNIYYKMGEGFIYTLDTYNGFKIVTRAQP